MSLPPKPSSPQPAVQIRETGDPVTLTIGAVADGEYLLRSGDTIVGGAGGGGGGGGVSGHVGTTIGAAARYFVAGARGATATTTVAPSTGTLRAMPFRCPNRSGTIDFVGINCTATATGAQGRLGIYRATSESNIYPGALIAESGVIDMSATGGTGVKSFNPSASFSPGEMLWVTYVCGTLAPTIRGPVVAACDHSHIGYEATLTTAAVGLTVAHAFGALPNPFTAGAAALTTVTIPGIFVRFSA